MYVTSEQRVDTSNSRQQRDKKDTLEILEYFQLPQRNLFSDDDLLRSIATGIIADDAVNANSAKTVGDLILNSMTGKQFPITYFEKRMMQLP